MNRYSVLDSQIPEAITLRREIFILLFFFKECDAVSAQLEVVIGPASRTLVEVKWDQLAVVRPHRVLFIFAKIFGHAHYPSLCLSSLVPDDHF